MFAKLQLASLGVLLSVGNSYFCLQATVPCPFPSHVRKLQMISLTGGKFFFCLNILGCFFPPETAHMFKSGRDKKWNVGMLRRLWVYSGLIPMLK